MLVNSLSTLCLEVCVCVCVLAGVGASGAAVDGTGEGGWPGGFILYSFFRTNGYYNHILI